MAAFDFPSSPNVNDIYTLNGVAFMWNGSVWKRYSTSTGAQGFQGDAGAAGAQGAQGTAGVLGSDGAQGAVGAQGAAGTGATGAQGAAGATGAQGAAGAQGTPFDRSEYNYTASGGQTAFAAAYANASDVDVFMNGVRLTPAEYTASGGTTITLTSGATAGDIIDILTFASAGPTGAQGAQGHQGDAFNRSESNFTATSGQTSFAPSGGYTNGDDLDVFVNGVRLTPADYTASNGTNVVLDVGANTGDIVDIIYYEAAGPAGAQGSAGIAGTVTFSTGAPSNPINGDLWYDTDDGAFAGYYDDGSTSQWIDLSGGPRGAQGADGADGAQGAAGSIPSNITAVNGTFSGNVSIGGTLTYEDVTNIDSVGVITARAGIRVTGDSIHVESSEDRLLYLKSTDANAYLTFEDTDSSSAFANRVGTVSDGLYFSTGGGGERLRIDSSGRLLIGRTSTSHEHPLQVQAASGANAIAIQGRSVDDQSEITFYENDNTTITAQIQQLVNRSIFRHRVGYLRFDSGGVTEKMRLDANGYLGINNAAPHNQYYNNLVIGDGSASGDKGITIRTQSSNEGVIAFSDADSGAARYAGKIAYNHGTNAMMFFTSNGDERLRITSDGDVNIGPAANANGHGLLTLSQSASAAFNALVIQQGNTAFTATDGLQIGIDAGVHAYIKQYENRDIYFTTGNPNTEKLRLTSDGKMGVNVTSPGCQTGGIHAVHDATQGTPSFTGAEVGIFQRNYNGAQDCAISIVSGTNASSIINFGDKDDVNPGIIEYMNGSNAMRFSTNAAERLRIASDGDVRIGDYNTVNRNAGLSVNKSDSRLFEMRVGNGTETNFVKRYGFAFVRSTSEGTYNLVSLGSVSGNSHVVIQIRMYAVSAVANQAAIITAYASARQQHPGTSYTYNVQTPTIEKFVVGTGIGVGSLQWTNGVLQYNSDANNNYTKYNTEITAWAHDRMDIGFS